MHPFVAEELFRAHAEDLRREADAARLAVRARRSTGRPRLRARAVVGTGLVRLGLRLAGTRTVRATEW